MTQEQAQQAPEVKEMIESPPAGGTFVPYYSFLLGERRKPDPPSPVFGGSTTTRNEVGRTYNSRSASSRKASGTERRASRATEA